VVDFNEGRFFGSASTKLSRDGWSRISEFAQLIAPFKDKVFIEIQGHSDSTPVIPKKNRAFVNNTELSVLRATDVFKRFAELGYRHQGLAVSGFGESYEIKEQDGQSSKAKSRRISFRITERGLDDI
jgi:chemotaxis protein MotB